jgi:hypothetical protein
MAVDVQVAIWIIQQRLKDKPPFEFETPTRTRDKKKYMRCASVTRAKENRALVQSVIN